MKPGPLHAIARAELYTAAGSPKVPLEPLLALLREAPELPQAAQLSRLAALRGATDADLPPLPEVHDLRWIAGAPSRRRAKGISDAASAALAGGRVVRRAIGERGVGDVRLPLDDLKRPRACRAETDRKSPRLNSTQ